MAGRKKVEVKIVSSTREELMPRIDKKERGGQMKVGFVLGACGAAGCDCLAA